MKEVLKIVEKIDLANTVVNLATFDDNSFDCLYLQLGKVVYTTLFYYEDEETMIENCPKIKNEDGDMVVDLFATYDQIIESGLWDNLEKNIDVKIVIKMIDELYEERKSIILNKTNFENRLLEIIEDLKVKFIDTMDKMDISKLENLVKDVPNVLDSLSSEQKELLNKVTSFDKKKK